MMSSTISDIERMLQTNLYIAKRNNTGDLSVLCNSNIFDAIHHCIKPEITISDKYIISHSPEIPPEYSLVSVINADANGK